MRQTCSGPRGILFRQRLVDCHILVPEKVIDKLFDGLFTF
jgi:hypothetical protein